MSHRPLAYFLKVPARVLGVELRPCERIVRNHVEGENTYIGIALSVQSENFQAMV